MARGFRCYQQYVRILRSNDLAEMYVEAVGEHQSCALFEVRLNIILIYGCLCFVRQQNLHYICTGYCFSYRQYFKAVILGSFKRFTFTKTDDNLKTTVT
ncbi:hypothetical protein D3C80_1775930 [compost metagenome]